jgi:hypothetical protein
MNLSDTVFPSATPPIDRVNLHAIELHVGRHISREFLLTANLSAWEDDVINGMCFDLCKMVYATDSPLRKQVVTYPKDWWEACKERWLPRLPRWLCVPIYHRYPNQMEIKYTTVVLTAEEIYPTFNPKLSGREAVVAVFKDL